MNLSLISQQENLTAATRLLAITLEKQPYMSIGDWFKSLSDYQFAELNNLLEEPTQEGDEELLLLTLMLSKAEASDVEYEASEAMARQFDLLKVLITCVSLEKKCLVKIHYENMTLGEDMGDRIVVERIKE
jgi:hypothetical protein